jgi:hypothetical protein
MQSFLSYAVKDVKTGLALPKKEIHKYKVKKFYHNPYQKHLSLRKSKEHN